MFRPSHSLLALFALLIALPAVAGDDERAPQQDGEVFDFDAAPWQVQLGFRSLQIEHTFPLVDRVALVPDAATYLDEIARWSPAGRWPVLIEDDHRTSMFIRRFAPAEVIRRESVDELPRDRADRQRMVEHTLTRTWGGDPARTHLQRIFAASEYTPPGVVFASMDDPAWPAAVALAAGRGQPIVWLNDQLRHPNAALDLDDARKLAATIEANLDALGYSWRNTGGGVDALTICRTMAGRVNAPRPDTNEVEPLAITDYLGRHANGERYAIVGWIFGDEASAAYIAMCSLFMPREHITMINTYSDQGAFGEYALEPAIEYLQEFKYAFDARSGSDVNRARWLRDLAGGTATDVLVMNSRGNARVFHVRDGDMTSLDVPVLNHPAAVHFTHSWSMRSPTTPDTVAAHWLQRGAYAYVGSMHEPYLHAFLTPRELTRRWSGVIPFLVAARHFEAPAPFGGPWRVNTFGDPLMLVGPPDTVRRQRMKRSAADGENLLDTVRDRMRAIDDDPSGKALADSLRLLDLLGRDDVAAQLWSQTDDKEKLIEAAGAALGPLFRKSDRTAFFEAWKVSGRRDEHTLNMLWHLHGGRLQTLRDDDDLIAMLSAIRRDQPHIDLGRLAPYLARRFGRDHVQAVLKRELDRTDSERANRAIRELMGEY